MSVERKRLFVGGLNSATNEQDIRERFKIFGSVLSVEIHRRPKSEGFPEKTFAYVEINALDSNIKRCITMLSNSKWRGGILKIQLAKESFLTRLQKEREEVNSNKSKNEAKESKNSFQPLELASPVPNALPGTIVPGKKNWVVGKFGRVLPIVYIRQKVGHKICRMDPSKTVHNLKRIKDENDEKPVSELTWCLERKSDDDDDDDKRGVIKGNKHGNNDDDDTDSSSEEFITDSSKVNKKEKSSPRKNMNKNIFQNEEIESFENKSRKRDHTSKKCITRKLSVDEKGLEHQKPEVNDNELDDNDNVIKDESSRKSDSSDESVEILVPVKQKRQNKKKRKTSDSSDCDKIDTISNGSPNETIVKKKRKSKKERKYQDSEEKDFKMDDDVSLLNEATDLRESQNDSEICSRSLDLKIKSEPVEESPNEKRIDKKIERKRKIKIKNGSVPEKEITAAIDVDNSDKKKRGKRKEQVCEQVKIVESTNDKNNDKREKKALRLNKENTSKKRASNEKRLQAAKEREARSISKQSIIASALKNLDTNDESMKSSKHIKFDEEYEEQEQMVEEKEEKTTRKISGSKASNWLGLDSASDDDDQDLGSKEIEDHLFAAKPQFEGETGQKLFKLQRSYRGDSRFQLDERFAESDSEPESEDETSTRQRPRVGTTPSGDNEIEATDTSDDMSKQLSREKDISMSVLRGILGQNFGTKYNNKNSSTKDRFTDSSLIHYDPTRDDHTQFEQIPKKQDSLEPTVDESQQEDAEVMRSAPEVTSEKYYDIKTKALTDMFGKRESADNATPFTFLADQDVTNDNEAVTSRWGETEELRSKPWNPVMLPYDSSGDEEDDMEYEEKEEKHVQGALEEERFFFHFGDPELENRVLGEESLFMRTQTLDQLNEHWIATRSDLTQDYKKKHKDALKRQSKMAAKRARMR